MKSCSLTTERNALIHGYSFQELLGVLLCVFFFICAGSLLTSCATGPHETYLKNTSLPFKSKVAILASVSAPQVSYSSAEGPTSLAFFPLFSLVAVAAAGVEEAIRSDVDKGHARKVKEHVDIGYFEEKVAQSFIQPLKKGNCFETIDYLPDKNQDTQRLSSQGYDVVIRLFVREISLKRIAGENVRLNVHVRGQMEHLSSGKVMWDREERILSSEFHSLDYYKENGLKELDAMLEKAGRNLAYDFVYLK